MDSHLSPARRVARKRARAFIATGAAALAAGALAAPAGAAVGGNHVVAALPDSSGLELTYPPRTTLAVSVLRSGVVLGTAAVTTDDQGAAAINGGNPDCWTGVTPDMVTGDTVEVTGSGFDDTMTVAAVTAGRPVAGATPDTVLVHGTADGRPPASTLEARVIGGSGDPFAATGGRALRAGVGQPWTIDYDGPTGGAWTATFSGLSAADVARALHATDSRGVVRPSLSELTISQNPAVRGPQAPCAAPLVANGVTSSSPSAVNIAHAGGDLVLSGVSRDASAVAVSVDDEDPATVPLTATATTSAPAGTQTWTATIPGTAVAGLGDGTLTASARYTTPAGSIGGATLQIRKDLSAPDLPTATPPPAAGPFLAAQAVTLSDTDTTAAIHWTADGSVPTAASPVLAPGAAIAVTSSQTIKAIAIDPAGNPGRVAVFSYTIATPVAGPGTGVSPGAAPTIIREIPFLLTAPVATARILGTASVARPAVRALRVHVLPGRALRVALRVDGRARVVRLRVFRARGARPSGAALATVLLHRNAGAGRYLATVRSNVLRALAAGSYVLEARAGRSADTLGAAVRVPFRLH